MKALFIACFLLAPPVWATLYSGDEDAIACASVFLDEALPQIAEAPLKVQVGWVGRLSSMLLSAGLPPDQAETILNHIAETLHRFKTSNDVVADLQKRVNLSDPSGRDLILCLLEDSELKFGRQVIYTFVDDLFDVTITQFTRFGGYDLGLLEGDHKQIHLIFSDPLHGIQGPRGLEEWTVAFFAALSQYADSKLVREWLQANLTLISQGSKADPLFRLYVRQSEGQLKVDDGFFRLFSLSRASSAVSALLQELHPEESVKAARSRAIQMGLAEIRNFPDVRREVRQLKVQAGNLLEIGSELGQQMKTTLAKSRKKR